MKLPEYQYPAIVVDMESITVAAVALRVETAEEWISKHPNKDNLYLATGGERMFGRLGFLQKRALFYSITGYASDLDFCRFTYALGRVIRWLEPTLPEGDLTKGCSQDLEGIQFLSRVRQESSPNKNKESIMAEEKKEAPKKPVVEKIEQNGVVRPKAGTKTGRVWEIADTISAEKKAPAPRKEVIEACSAEQINASTAATQYGRWRKFNGLEGRAPKTDQSAEGSSDTSVE